MKTTILSTLGLIATVATASAHPGHDHSQLSTTEFAAHQLLSTGAIGIAALSLAFLGYRSMRKRISEA